MDESLQQYRNHNKNPYTFVLRSPHVQRMLQAVMSDILPVNTGKNICLKFRKISQKLNIFNRFFMC